jgi:hypothetical protein
MSIPRHIPPLVRAARIVVLACLVAGAAVACGDDPSASNSAGATVGLVVLSGTPNGSNLTTFDTRGTARPLGLPIPFAWISAGQRGTLIGTTTSGGLFLSDRVTADAGDDLLWRIVQNRDLPEEPLLFATWSANGLRLAAVATDFADRHSLAIVDPVGDSSLIIPLGEPILPAPPAWIDEQRVGVATPQGLLVVDTSTGETAPGPPGIRLFTVSADGGTVALVTPDGEGLEIRTTAEWLAQAGAPMARIGGSGDASSLAFDRLGGRLAVVWERGRDPGLIIVYGRDAGWNPIGRLELPERAARGTVTWLP